MSVEDQKVLVFPRDCIRSCERFVPWKDAIQILKCAESRTKWLPRRKAEMETEWVQPIPCTIIRAGEENFYVLRRIHDGRYDLRDRISLVVGGHIDKTDANDSEKDFLSLLTQTLQREVEEELNLKFLSELKPLGLVIDSSSVAASRHIGFVHDIKVEGKLKPRAAEEFSARSKFSGQVYNPAELSNLRKDLDPWSLIIFADYISPSYSLDMGQQSALPLTLTES